MTTIMIVDDEPAIGEILTMFLTEKNYAVTSFTSGKDALNHLATNKAVGLLLTDLDMPEMTGLELIRQVKTLYPALPMICMSGSADGQDRDEVFKLCADFICKPFNLFELLERINARLPPDTSPRKGDAHLWTGKDKPYLKKGGDLT